MKLLVVVAVIALVAAQSHANDMVQVDQFKIDRTEDTVGAFREFVEATGLVTLAEKAGGGLVYEAGWVQKPGWSWKAPYGTPARDDEPTVHVTFDEAQLYCEWRGVRLPTDTEWVTAAYQEYRASPPPPFQQGEDYPYPTGNSPAGANCLNDCVYSSELDNSAVLTRGAGHAPVGTTKPGVNGLYDMGANVWEWVDSEDKGRKITRGGSWWYGAQQMHKQYLASKPADTAVVYIGFRCAR